LSPPTNQRPGRYAAVRRERQHWRQATHPRLRLVPADARRASRPPMTDLVADILVDAGFINIRREASGEVRYGVADPFAGDGAFGAGARGDGR
jgi:hypothetical protein